jgi:hypothetical protein
VRFDRQPARIGPLPLGLTGGGAGRGGIGPGGIGLPGFKPGVAAAPLEIVHDQLVFPLLAVPCIVLPLMVPV